jgi:prepilin-type N-terminal cleavage/methylation domain-containing protein
VSPRGDRRGFTVIELVVAVVILTVGLLALAAGTAIITRTLANSRRATEAVQLAARRIDNLRAAAASTTPRCTAPTFTSSPGPIVTQGITQTWVVPPNGALRVVRAIVTYPVGRGRTKTDTLATNIPC